MQCQPYSEEKRLDFWVEKVDLLHYFWEIDLEKNRLFRLGPAPIQLKLQDLKRKEVESQVKGFSRLMLEGKVGQALKLINNDDAIVGVHKLTREIKGTLLAKHPAAETPPADILLPEVSPEAQSVIFEAISAEAVEKAVLNVNGAGGLTHIDADGWKQIHSKASGKLPF